LKQGWSRRALILAGLLSLLALVWLFSAPDDSGQAHARTLVERLENSARARLSFLWRQGSSKRRSAGQKTSNSSSAKSRERQQPGTIVQVQVLDDRLKPVRDARISFEQLKKGAKPIQLTSSGSGSASGELPGGTYQLAVSHPKYAPYKAAPVIALADQPLNITVVLDAAVTITGTVVDEENRPLAGVHVNGERRRVEHLQSGGSTYVNNAAYTPVDTSAAGKFEMADVAIGPTRFAFTLEGFATVDQEVDIPAGGLKEPMKIVLARPAIIAGQLVDEQQHPVTSATVRVRRFRRYGDAEAQTSPTVSVVSSTTGAFTLRHLLQEAAYDIQVDHPSYATAVFPAVPANSHDLVWTLERGGRIEGRALFIDRPSTAAQVLLTAQAVIQGTTITKVAASTGTGDWAFEHLPYGTYKLGLREEEFGMDPKPPLVCEKDRPTTGVLVEVYAAIPLLGKAIDVETGGQVEGAKITSHASYGYAVTRTRDFTATTDEHGEFLFPRLPSGVHSLVGKADGYLPSDAGGQAMAITLQRGDTPHDLVVPMSRGGSVEGYVRDAEGDALPDADVQLFAASTTLSNFPVKDLHTVTDAGGRFYIRGFPLGERVQLFASAAKPGYAKSRSPLMDLGLDRPRAVTAVTLTAGGVVTGRVTDVSGHPLPLTKMTFESREFLGDPSSSGFSVQTGTDGTYLLEHCTPGSMRVTAARQDYVTQVRTGTVKEGSLLSRFDFKLVSGNKIAGTVADYQGRPIAGARVSATPLEKASGTGTATTDKRGQFTIPNLSGGFFRVEASFPLTTPDGQQQYTFIERRVPSGSITLPIDCDLEASARGELLDEDGTGINQFKLTLRSRLDTNPPQDFRFSIERSVTAAHGMYRLLQVPRGLYTMELKAEGYEPYRSDDIVIGPGAHTNLATIRLRSATGIKGTVVSATTGKPVANATVRVLDTSKGEVVTVNRIELAAYNRSDVIEYLDSYFDSNADLDPNRQFRPVARVRANVSATAKTDFLGRFTVSGTAPGQYTLEFEHPSYSLLRLDRIAVSRAEVTDLGEVQLEPGGELRGQVLDGAGRPVYNATVYLRGERAGRNSTHTDLGGNYMFRGASPGRRTVVVRATVGARSVYAFGFAEVREDLDSTYNFVLALDATVRGTLLSPDTPAKTGSVRLYPLDEDDAPVTDIHYDGTARGPGFSIAGIPAGSYMAVATGTAASSFALWQQVDVYRGENAINFPLGSGFVSGVTVTPAGPLAPGVRLQLRPEPATAPLPPALYTTLVRSATSSASSKYSFAYLPAGIYTIYAASAASPAYVPVGTIAVSTGQRILNFRIAAP
jgi:protocatechuate 3,4-dioxygenase beta subunit